MTVGAGIAILGTSLALAEIPLSERRSGYDQLSPATKTMQDDDTSNPAMLSVLDGEALWARKAGEANKSCADCHGDAASSMRGVSARYPAFSSAKDLPIDIEQRVNLCRTEQQKAPALAKFTAGTSVVRKCIGKYAALCCNACPASCAATPAAAMLFP